MSKKKTPTLKNIPASHYTWRKKKKKEKRDEMKPAILHSLFILLHSSFILISHLMQTNKNLTPPHTKKKSTEAPCPSPLTTTYTHICDWRPHPSWPSQEHSPSTNFFCYQPTHSSFPLPLFFPYFHRFPNVTSFISLFPLHFVAAATPLRCCHNAVALQFFL